MIFAQYGESFNPPQMDMIVPPQFIPPDNYNATGGPKLNTCLWVIPLSIILTWIFISIIAKYTTGSWRIFPKK